MMGTRTGWVPTRLRVEHLEEPLGIDVRAPRLSWWLPEGSHKQVAFQLRAGNWDSGRVESSCSVLVPYKGPDLVSGERVEWRVKVWTEAGESEWSDPAWWEMGLLGAEDWVARWIEPVEAQRHITHPAHLMRGSFELRAAAEQARLYATAHGVYEFFINGARVGDCELTPGFTSYGSRLQVQTFDVGHLLQVGENVWGAIVSDGWFRGQNGVLRQACVYGDAVALLAQLNVFSAGGAMERFGTGSSWKATVGPIRAADLMEGQRVDFRYAIPDWNRSGTNLGTWSPVTERDYDLKILCSSPSPPVRRVQRIRPVAVTRPRADRQVVDLGQNINGWVCLSKLSRPGNTLTLAHSEALDANGDVTIEHLTAKESDLEALAGLWDLSNLSRPFQVDQVTASRDASDCFEPRHTAHGFRYVRIEGHEDEIGLDDVTGIVVHTDLRRTGWFECSDERVNRLHEAAVWTFRNNACDIPTDCPTRERQGWTGDWQLFVPTAAFLYDVAGFSVKWLRDLAAEQHPDGFPLQCVPDPNRVGGRVGLDTPMPPGSAGWGDAAVIVPWEIYRAYGDREVLEEQWPSMSAWVEYGARAAREHRHESRRSKRPVASPHEAFLWDTGVHWGEWLEPGQSPDALGIDFDAFHAALAVADPGPVATAYLHYSSHLLAEIAKVLGRSDDAVRYERLAEQTATAWQAEFLRPDGTLDPASQATYVRALAFNLVPEQLRAKMAERLVSLVRQAGTHLGTGFLATPLLLPVLADAGQIDVAYELLFQDSEPSWLTMIDRGATTIWELWHGIDDQGAPHASLDHPAKGAVITFLHRYVAGIQLLDEWPGYKHFAIAPMPGGGITWARGAHDSPYGRIGSYWWTDAEGFWLEVTVPAGTSAEVHLPDGQHLVAFPGTTRYGPVVTRANKPSSLG